MNQLSNSAEFREEDLNLTFRAPEARVLPVRRSRIGAVKRYWV
jgi:hypothetical protein